jgi:hypothetical protein
MTAVHQALLMSGVGSAVSAALLMHCDGSDGSTTFTDSSPYARTLTGSGGAQISTAQSVFGGASLDLTDAGNNAAVTTGAHAGLSVTTGDFCLEFRFRMTSVAAGIYFVGCDGTTTDLYIHTSNVGQLGFYALGNSRLDKAAVITNTWYAFCMDRAGSNIKVFLDGTEIDNSTSGADMGATGNWFFGSLVAIAGSGAGGRCFMDEIRLTVGTSLHQANYTPSATPF